MSGTTWIKVIIFLFFVALVIPAPSYQGHTAETRHLAANMKGVTLDVYAQFFGSLTGKKIEADPRIKFKRFSMYLHKIPDVSAQDSY